MRIRQVTLREIQMPLLAPFETSMNRTTVRRILLVEADVDGVSGWGEVTAGEDPYYSYETTDTAWLILREYIWPALRGREMRNAAEVAEALAHIRGHNMAQAGVETAVWDAEARQAGRPLWKFLGGTREEIPCGVSIGIQSSPEQLTAAVAKELDAGYQRIKIKIRPGWDARAIGSVRAAFPKVKLMADANSAYSLSDIALLKELDRFDLMMIEQPLGWNDIHSHAQLQKELRTPICLDECIHGEPEARAAIELRACRIMNIKLGRVGGHSAARRVHDVCRSAGIPVWCGGMLESGIGRAHNIAMSTLPNFSLPGDVSASRRYWSADIIDPEVEVSPRGTIRAPSTPGIGFSPRVDRIDELTVRKEVLQ